MERILLLHGMYTVYILKSLVDDHYYYGFTIQDVRDRLREHNSGRSYHTNKYKPWKIVWYGVFFSESQAKAFEKYLKSGSGHAFSRKRLL